MIDQDPKILQLLDEIVAMELGGVLRFTHYSLMVTGPYRIPIVEFMQGQATEALAHAQRAGEILTGLGGHPTMHVSAIEETGKHSTLDILEESYAHEKAAIGMYHELYKAAEGKSVFLEEFGRGMVAVEEEHMLEMRKMLRDFEG
ncbi:MAG: bacterioferritin [Planctomycetota bacterium]|jgi:bacterioferritin